MTGTVAAIIVVESKSSAIPLAIFPIILAVARGNQQDVGLLR